MSDDDRKIYLHDCDDCFGPAETPVLCDKCLSTYAPLSRCSRCWRCKHDVPEDTVVCFAGVGTQCKDRKACRERSYVAPEPATPPEHPQTQNAYYLGTIVGAAIVAWGDAMREREEGKRRAKDLEALMLEEDMG